MKHALFTFILLTSILGHAQSLELQVIGSLGGTFTNAETARIDFTAGEFTVSTLTDGETILTQGFHQEAHSAPLSIDSEEITLISLYPNPVKSNFYIKGLKGQVALYIYDINGRLVHKNLNYLDATSIDISNLRSAIYMVHLTNEQGAVTKRLVKN